jgi:hypothetical protein
VPLAPIVTEKLQVDAFSVVAQAQSELRLVIPDFQFDVVRLGVPKSVSQGLAGNPVDFVPHHRVKIAGRAFHLNMKYRSARIAGCFISCKFLSEPVQSLSKIVGHHHGGAQILHGVKTFLDGMSGSIDGTVQCLLAFLGTRRKEIGDRLKMEQVSLKAL